MITEVTTALAEVTTASAELSANIGPGLLLMLLGMTVVFTALIVIWLVMEAVGAVFARADKKKLQNKAAELTTPVLSATTGPNPSEAELIAAITAAISAHTGRPAFAFRVVSFRERV